MSVWAGLLPPILYATLGFTQPHLTADSLQSKPADRLSSSDFFNTSSTLSTSSHQPVKISDHKRHEEQSVLPLFGFELFNRNGKSDASTEPGVLSLPPHYQLGPGDRLGIYLLGTVQESIDVMVNVEGKIFLPPAGVIDVWGMEIAEFKALLSKKLAKYYDNFTLDLMLLQPKNVMVAVVGDVIRPGKYVLSAFNTVLDAVVMAGGPSERGSIRGIQLIRRDSLVTTVDLYRFLMTGENDEDAFLQAGDRIYVPLAEHRVMVTGEVGRPSIFELKPTLDERISDVIALAGGFTELAYESKVEISRLLKNGNRELIYVDFFRIAQEDSSRNILVASEDRIKVYSKLQQVHERIVSIYGEVRNPGQYVLEENMHLSDLILKAGNLTRKAFVLEAEVAKVDPGQPADFIKVNLQKMTNGSQGSNGDHAGNGDYAGNGSDETNGHSDLILEEDDQVFIRQIPDWEVNLTVELLGEVKFPGVYSIVKDKTYLSDILEKSGGFTEDAFLSEAYVIRPSTRAKYDKEFERLGKMRREEMTDLEYQYFVMRQNSAAVDRIVVDFEKLVNHGDSEEDIILEDGDRVIIPKAPKVVMVTGSVATPGGVTFKAGAKLGYYLAKAGGASWDAKLSRAKIVKVTGEVLDDEDVEHFSPGDIIWVPRRSDKKFWPVFLQTVTVLSQIASIYLIMDRAVAK